MRTLILVIVVGLLAFTMGMRAGRYEPDPAVPPPSAASNTRPSRSVAPSPTFEILSHSSLVQRNYTYVNGEAQNISDQPARLSVHATFYDESGTVVGTRPSNLNAMTRSVPPGEVVPFTMMQPNDQAGVTYQLRVAP